MHVSNGPAFLVLTDGSFGDAVGQALGASAALSEFFVAPPDNHDFIGVAMTHKRLGDLRALDDWCRKHGKRWACVFLADRYLYCGPHFDPTRQDAMACFQCFYQRDLTHLEHGRDPKREIAIDEFFDLHPEEEVGGFTPGTVGMAVAFLRGAARGDIASGRLRRVNLLEGIVDDTEVFGIHHCPRCSPRGPDRHEDTCSRLIRELASLV